jgi:dTDP-4-dehydrorhamnose 3,5-epimerase-like enzyme
MKHTQITPATTDARGCISDVLYDTPIEHVAIIESLSAGVVRGNHYHERTTQHILVTRGSLRYWYQPLDKSAPVASVLVREKEMVSTPPLEVHALEILEPNQFVVFCHGPRGGANYEADTIRVPPIFVPR